ncbi:hypothetical protein J1N35_010110 [Gossypium stocksii]|uniref:RNase H type-1 domain-containing protein n=1 Tax=Gossypium stocksii TaxID=47602 RepID=A0A9D3W0D7_9ROSI|nr:hypothetical protein J1N35_010110 [Gossypium stocksii]
MAEDLGFRKLVVGGDSLTIVKKAQSLEKDRSSVVASIKHIKEISRRFEEITFRFASKSVNRTAHAMVEEGWELSSSTYWIEEASVRVEEKAERDRRACCD